MGGATLPSEVTEALPAQGEMRVNWSPDSDKDMAVGQIFKFMTTRGSRSLILSVDLEYLLLC